jgi:hypothetical protein
MLLVTTFDWLFDENKKKFKKKCVTYPQEDFLFLKYFIVHLSLKSSTSQELTNGICRLDPKSFLSYRNAKLIINHPN